MFFDHLGRVRDRHARIGGGTVFAAAVDTIVAADAGGDGDHG